MSPKKTYTPPPIENRELTNEQIEHAIIKLNRRKIEVEQLASNRILFDDATVEIAESNIRYTIREIFGKNSPEYNEHAYYEIWHGGHITGEPRATLQSKFDAGIPQTVTILNGLIARLKERQEDIAFTQPTTDKQNTLKDFNNRRVFIVHGHDEESKEKLARFLTQLELEPIILHEQPNEGKTIIEKFETYTNVAYAVVLLTPDDICAKTSNPEEKLHRSRQNVIFELGFFMGKLGRNHVSALHKGDVELPSDYHGVVYIKMDDSEGWKLLLAREIKQVIKDLDLNKIV